VTAHNAEIFAVGSELLTPTKIDTNSLWLTDQLNALGLEVTAKSIVGDDRARLTEAIRAAISRAQIVLITGGLGPTEDDVTRDAVAGALGRTQNFREDVCEQIADRFRRLRRPMAEINKRQAWVIDGAEVLPNDRGTAPGQWLAHDDGIIALLPGPPREMKAMFDQHCLDRFKKLLPPMVIRTKFYRVSCMGESDVDQMVAPVYTQYTNPVTTILAGIGDIQLHLRARASTAEEAEALLEKPGTAIEALLGDSICSTCGEPLEKVVGSMLLNAGKRVAFAESLTGGGLAGRFTSVPGASRYFAGAAIVYTDEAKRELLGVPSDLLAEHSAVSEPVASALAERVRSRLKTDYGVSLTGYAGPEGGDERNPVGTVFIGIAGPDQTKVRRMFFAGDRDRIRALATVWALDLLRRALLAA
jgi:nicotinamide-nucleotide amidase